MRLVLPEGGLIDSAVAAEAAHRADAAAARGDRPEAWSHDGTGRRAAEGGGPPVSHP
ncbi:hypothetical protein GCM10017577_34670 [Pseudonocardia halophobica]|uniref:Uncharacterized protein n=1 Tax=Pseudonocardia halophobica TaxID=29401 RepID=A0A9W6NX73_9PSEU|nr:hypothetical protein [Pseudonocardia halophobica]GLL12326.1 hypothetical protein GCM10017577_34670 [Pseudonocardia halophobica]